MSDKEKNIIYTARDIEQYLAGKLSPGQMHAMEKAALDDPFLSEAMEGYEGMKEKDWNNQLVALRQQISEKSAVAKVIPLHKSTGRWWKIAAAVFVIGCGTVLTFILTKDKTAEKNNQQIAQKIAGAPDSGTLKDKPTLPETETVKPVTSSTKEKEVTTTTNGNGLITQTNPPIKIDDRFVYRPGKVQATDSLNLNQAGLASALNNNPSAVTTINPPAPANNNAALAEVTFSKKNNETAKQKNNNADVLNRQVSAANAISKREQALNNYFTAQVVSADNSPLPFTNISIKKENFGTYADAKGMVRLVSTDSILNIEVKSVGYLPRNFLLRSNQPQNKIVLQEEEMTFKDNPVIGKKDMIANLKSRRATLLTDSVVNVEPADGWANYNTYVANNIEIPEEMLKKDFHGEVELSFDVKKNGTISNIRVNKSLGAAYDEEAKRLIQQGPQWKIKKGRKTSARVKVQF